MKHIQTIYTGSNTQVQTNFGHADTNTGCGECQTSCQSACKTSCTVGNQCCEQRQNTNQAGE